MKYLFSFILGLLILVMLGLYAFKKVSHWWSTPDIQTNAEWNIASSTMDKICKSHGFDAGIILITHPITESPKVVCGYNLLETK